jgi:hypothetical protein
MDGCALRSVVLVDLNVGAWVWPAMDVMVVGLSYLVVALAADAGDSRRSGLR